MMNFVQAVQSVLTTNYANFNGRASRSEYWYWILFSFIIGLVFWALIKAVPAITYVQMIYGLATIIPALAVGIRRLHDVGRSGWWILIALTLIGVLLLLFWAIQPSEGDNQYGPTPSA